MWISGYRVHVLCFSSARHGKEPGVPCRLRAPHQADEQQEVDDVQVAVERSPVQACPASNRRDAVMGSADVLWPYRHGLAALRRPS